MNEPVPRVTIVERLARFGLVLVHLALLGTAMALVRHFFWVFEVAACFRVQYFVVLTVGGVLWLVRGSRRRGLLVCAVGVFNAAYIAPLYIAPATVPAAQEIRVRAVFMNVHTANTRSDLVLDYLKELDPDFIGLSEVNSAWLASCSVLEARYPYFQKHPRDDNFGIAFYSRFPTGLRKDMFFADENVPSIIATVEIGSRTLTILATHPLPPRLPSYAEVWAAQMDLMGRYFAAVPAPRLVMGDLNTSPWCARFDKLLTEGGLVDTARGFGVQLTWPTNAFFLRTALDHILVSPDVRVIDRRVGRWVGSDHYPVIADLAIGATAGSAR